MGGFASVAASIGMQVAKHAAQQQQAKATTDAQGQQQALQSQMMWQQQEQHAKQQRNLLARQLASARASLAGGGIGFAGGSGQALMAGMARQSQEDIADGFQSTRLRHELQFGGERGGGSGQGLQQGLAMAQQGYDLIRPLFSKS
jgi:hypothetical protein